MKEVEVFGVDYERYALMQVTKSFAKRNNIKTVLEIPAGGVKAMPSIYSIGFGMAGCKVTLMNGEESRLDIWKTLGLEKNVSFSKCDDIQNTGLDDNKFDLVWNFAIFNAFEDPMAVLKEMKRISKKHVAVFCVNGYNVGFPIHCMVHKANKIPWTHGDINLNFPQNVKSIFKEQGLKRIKTGVVDCPIWPDLLGFRDVKLHKANKDMRKLDWHSNLIGAIKTNKVPMWIKVLYHCWEQLPMPVLLKLPYAHIFYVLGEKG